MQEVQNGELTLRTGFTHLMKIISLKNGVISVEVKCEKDGKLEA